MKKALAVAIILMMISAICMSIQLNSYAVDNCTMELQLSKSQLKKGEEFTVDVNIANIQSQRGVISLSGILEYDKDSLQVLKLEGKNGWESPKNESSYNEDNGKFAIVRDAVSKNNETIFTISFKVLDSAKENLDIKISDIGIADGDVLFRIAEIKQNITVTDEEPLPQEDKITSQKYIIGDTEITRIPPKTTVREFRKNIEANCDVVITDKNGNVLAEDDIIKTGMTLKGGKTLQYTMIVIGDITGNGEIDITDLAKAKLHIIDIERLTGIYLKAADVDANNEIDVKDIAQMKLVLIGLMEIK